MAAGRPPSQTMDNVDDLDRAIQEVGEPGLLGAGDCESIKCCRSSGVGLSGAMYTDRTLVAIVRPVGCGSVVSFSQFRTIQRPIG